jgi:hypothetical protein
MGTKNNPGKFDCLEKAEADEPFFVLLARDPHAAHLVSIWAKLRVHDFEAATAVFNDLMRKIHLAYPDLRIGDMEKANEAIHCSSAMFSWIRENRPERSLNK